MGIDYYTPHISNFAFVAPSATLCGSVEVWDYASVWSDVVVRGDVRLVRIGAYSNIQVGSCACQALGVFSPGKKKNRMER